MCVNNGSTISNDLVMSKVDQFKTNGPLIQIEVYTIKFILNSMTHTVLPYNSLVISLM